MDKPSSAPSFSDIADSWSDRRAKARFPVEEEVRYRLLDGKKCAAAGVGRTLNISSSGILFMADACLMPGKQVELAINWPAQLNAKCPLRLVARGRVTRCRGRRVAVEIDNYEFRTRGAARPDA